MGGGRVYVTKAGDPRIRDVAYFCVEVPCQETCPDATVAALKCLVSVSNLSATELCCSWTEVEGCM